MFSLRLGRKRKRGIWSWSNKRAKKKQNDLVSKIKFSILVKVLNSGRHIWHKFEVNDDDVRDRECIYPFHKEQVFKEYCDSAVHSNYSDAVMIGSKVYAVMDYKNVVFFDVDNLQDDIPLSWAPVPSSPRLTPNHWAFHPNVLSHKGRLYILGCSRYNESDSHFGAMFDPQNDSWFPIIKPPDSQTIFMPLFLSVSILDCILLMNYNIWFFDESSSKWRSQPPFRLFTDYIVDPPDPCFDWLEHTNCGDLHSHMIDVINGNLVVVEQHSTIYWISNTAHIYAHNWKTLETQFGAIVGLEHTDFSASLSATPCSDMPLSLFHLEGDLFCLLYQDCLEYSPSSNFHCLVARLIKHKSSVSLNVIRRFCAPISGICCKFFLMR